MYFKEILKYVLFLKMDPRGLQKAVKCGNQEECGSKFKGYFVWSARWIELIDYFKLKFCFKFTEVIRGPQLEG